jgi:hypothetical protein
MGSRGSWGLLGALWGRQSRVGVTLALALALALVWARSSQALVCVCGRRHIFSSQMRATVSNLATADAQCYANTTRMLAARTNRWREARNASGQPEIGPSQIQSFALSVSCAGWAGPSIPLSFDSARRPAAVDAYRALPSPCRRAAVSPWLWCYRCRAPRLHAVTRHRARYLLLPILRTRPWPWP